MSGNGERGTGNGKSGGVPSSPFPAPRSRHLVLIGPPGVGKSTVGRLVAERLALPFLDFDEEVERRERRTVAAIFRDAGEPHFRALEAALTAELASAPPHVLAPGGGWAAQPGLVALLRPVGCIIHLTATPRTLARRLGPEAAARPLLAGGDLVARLEALLHRRAPAYGVADHVVDTELLDLQGVVRAVAVLAAPCGGG